MRVRCFCSTSFNMESYENGKKIFSDVIYNTVKRHSMINHCDRRITLLGDLDISFVLLNTFSKFLLHLECYLLSHKRNIKISKQLKQTTRYIGIAKMSDTSITVIYHTMSLSVLYFTESKRYTNNPLQNIIFCVDWKLKLTYTTGD